MTFWRCCGSLRLAQRKPWKYYVSVITLNFYGELWSMAYFFIHLGQALRSWCCDYSRAREASKWLFEREHVANKWGGLESLKMAWGGWGVGELFRYLMSEVNAWTRRFWTRASVDRALQERTFATSRSIHRYRTLLPFTTSFLFAWSSPMLEFWHNFSWRRKKIGKKAVWSKLQGFCIP